MNKSNLLWNAVKVAILTINGAIREIYIRVCSITGGSNLRRAGYSIPNSDSKATEFAIRQEVVKLDVLEHENSSRHMKQQNTRIASSEQTPSIAAEIVIGNVSIRLYKGADSQLIQNTIHSIGGISHAW